eukprot:g6036.t1
MAELAKVELDQTNKLSRPKSAAEFLKEFDSPWSGLARSRRLSVGTQDTIRLLRTHTRETFDQVTNTSLTDALDSMDLDAIDCSNIPVFEDDGNNKKSEENTYNNSDNNKDKTSSVSNIETKKIQNDTKTISVSSHNASNTNLIGDSMPSLSVNNEENTYIWKNKNNRGSGIQLGARLRKEIVENYNMLQQLPTVKHPIRKVTRFSMEKPRVILLKPDGISICKFKQKSKGLEETTFVPYETISEALLIDHTSILIQVNDYHDLQWKSNMAPTILSDIAVRLEIVSLLSQKREQLHTIESVAKHMYRWGVIDSKVLTKSNINIKDNDVYGVRENLIVRKTQSSLLGASEIDRRYASRKDSVQKDRSTSYFFFNRNGDKKKKGRGRNSLKVIDDDNSNSNADGITNNTEDKNMKIKDNNSLSGVPKPKLSLTRKLSYNALKNEAKKERNKKSSLKEKNSPKKATSLRKSIIERMVEKIEDPVESQVRFYVQKIVYDQETDEGRTRMHFIEESKKLFQCIEKGTKHSEKGSLERESESLLAPLKKTRLFIDGMREYIMEHHEKELVKIVNEISTSESSTSSLSTNNGEGLNTIEEESDDKRTDTLRLEAIVTKCAEQSIVKNLFPLILKNLEEVVTKDQTAKWLEQYSKLSLKPQEFFEIPNDHQCEMEWYEASLACADIGKSKTASEKMEALLDTARLIYERFHELNPKTVLGADDFMPIFMFVVSRGGLDRAFYDKEYLVHLCPANVLDGEGAYYLSTFEAALTFMLGMKV